MDDRAADGDSGRSPRQGSWALVAASLLVMVGALVVWRARRRTEAEAPLDALLPRMQTGDLLLFSNRGRERGTHPVKGTLTSAATYVWRGLEGCEFSHVAMVWRHPRTLEVFCLESYAYLGDQGVRDELTQTVHSGPQIVRLRDRLQSYEGYAAWRPLGRPLDPHDTLHLLVSAMDEDLAFRPKLLQRFADRAVGLEGDLDGVQGTHPEGAGMSCTELLGRLYTATGAIRKERVPPLHAWTPRDFAEHPSSRWAPGYAPKASDTVVITV